jgi:hypothetical protein
MRDGTCLESIRSLTSLSMRVIQLNRGVWFRHFDVRDLNLIGGYRRFEFLKVQHWRDVTRPMCVLL